MHRLAIHLMPPLSSVRHVRPAHVLAIIAALVSRPTASWSQTQPAPRVVELPPGGAVVPLDGASTRPIVRATINGHGPYRFIVETGAPFTGITPAVAESLGLVPTDTANPTVTVSTLAIGDARLRDFRVDVVGAPTAGVDGVLGLNAYRDLLLTIDYAAGTMRLARGTLAAANGRDRLALLAADDLWEIELTVDGRPVRAVLDTQSGTAFTVTPTAVAGVHFAAGPVATGTVSGPGIGVQQIRHGRLARDILVGDVPFRTPIVGVVPMPPGYPQHWNIGGPALAAFTLTLDQRSRVVQLARPSRAAVDAPRALGFAGFKAALRAGRRIVTEVTAGSVADSAGLRIGDEIVRVDDTVATSLGADAWAERLRRPGPLALHVRRDDNEIVVALVVPVLVP